MRTILLIIDGFGIGEMPDAKIYNDTGANTYKAIVDGIRLPNLVRLGLNNIFDSAGAAIDSPIGCYARMKEYSAAKDTLTGHHEIAGVITYDPPTTYPNGFPREIISHLELAFGSKIIGNEVASGTEIIMRLGDEHMATGNPIVYTSADSVLQIACHEDVVPLAKLYQYCEYALSIMQGKYSVARIIARPFTGRSGAYRRTSNRKDYCMPPSCETMPERLNKSGINTIAIGKIYNIFSGRGFTKSIEAHSNDEVGKAVLSAMHDEDNCLIFANFVDTDMMYGHRRDVSGYRSCMESLDVYIGEVVNSLKQDDMLIITSDHGCDPSFRQTTDHTREYVPMIIYGKNLNSDVNLNTLYGFDTVAHTVLDYHKIMSLPKSVLGMITGKKNKN